MGHDRLISLVDDWGPGDTFPLDINDLQADKLSRISFLLGGVGDGKILESEGVNLSSDLIHQARHAYSTIIGANRARKSLSKAQRSRIHVHITLLDINAGVLARDICIMMLLHDLAEKQLDSVTRCEIKATIFYTFAGIAMPSYCYLRSVIPFYLNICPMHSRLRGAIYDAKTRLLKCPARLPQFLHVNSEAIPNIIVALDYWAAVELSTTQMLLEHTPPTSGGDRSYFTGNDDVSPGYIATSQEGAAANRQAVYDLLDSFTDDHLLCFGYVAPGQTLEEAKRQILLKRESIVDHLVENTAYGSWPGRLDEEAWYWKTKVFLPPKELWGRHPGFSEFENFKVTRRKLPTSWESKVSIESEHVSTSVNINFVVPDQEPHRKDLEN